MAGIPCTGREVLHSDFGVFGVPDFIQPVLVEKHRNIERIAAGKREIPSENRDFRWRCHGIIVGLNRIDGSFLECPEKLPGGYQLIGKIQFNFHFITGHLVEAFDRGLDHVFRQGGAGIGLHPPAYLRFGMNRGRSDHRGSCGCPCDSPGF